MTSGSQQLCSGFMFGIVMIATWAANLQADAAAWTPHSFELRIHARYAGIYFKATRQLPDGHHQQIQCHVTLLKSEKDMKALTPGLLQKAHAKAAEVIEKPMEFATENPILVYRKDEILHRALITFHVQRTTHIKLFRFRNWLVQAFGGSESNRKNLHASVDEVCPPDEVD